MYIEHVLKYIVDYDKDYTLDYSQEELVTSLLEVSYKFVGKQLYITHVLCDIVA